MKDEMRLTPFEKRMLTYVGQHRWKNGRPRDHGLGPSQTATTAVNDIRGAKCEFVAAILLNRSWQPHVGDIYQRDVGGLVEVRSTVLADGRLIIKPNAADEAPYVLVREFEDDDLYRMLGWLFAWQGKTFPLLTGFGDPAHFVDQAHLKSMDELRRWLLEMEQSWQRDRKHD